MMVNFLKSDISVQSYVLLKFPVWKVQNSEINLQSWRFEGILEQYIFQKSSNLPHYENF